MTGGLLENHSTVYFFSGFSDVGIDVHLGCTTRCAKIQGSRPGTCAGTDCSADMKSWGRYELVSSPAASDLVVEVSWILSDTGLRLPVLGQLRVTILDPRMHITLWTFNEYVRGAIFLGNRKKNFDQAMRTIMERIKKL